MPRLDRGLIVCVLLGAVFATTTLAWLALDRSQPNWDDAWYLTNSLTVYDALTHGGIAGYLTKLNSVFGFKAPLIAALPTPFYLIFGRRWHAAYLVNIASMAMLFFAIYRIARRWWTPRAAILGIAIAGTLPLLYGLARWFLVEYALTALVALAICTLLESDGLKKPAWTLLFGGVCGLGLLLKVSFPVFVLLPILYVWIKSGYRTHALLPPLLVCLTLALPWYLGHLRPTIANAIAAGFGPSAEVQGTGPIFTLRALGTYLSRVAHQGLSDYYCWLAVVTIACLSLRPGKSLLRSLAPQSRAILLLWILPFALFLFGGNKDVRYIAPILPAFALLAAAAMDLAVPRNVFGNVLAGLILVMPFMQMFSISFGIPFHSAAMPYARRFSRVEWPHGSLLKAISANSNLKPGARQTILVGSDRSSFNANNIELAVVAEQLPFDVETTAHEKDRNTLLLRLRQSSFFLYKEGGEPESTFFNPYLEDLVRRARQDGRYAALTYQPRLPDGGVAHILKNSGNLTSTPANGLFLPAASNQAEEFMIPLGGTMALTSFSVRRTPESVVVRFRWRSLKPPDRDYWCFTHVIDSSGRIIGQLDHRILGGTPPLTSWTTGDSGIEDVPLPLPAGSSGAGLRVRFGLYDPPSGERLGFGALTGLPSSKFTAADQFTALIAPI